MTPRISSFQLSRPRWRHSYGPFAAFARVRRRGPPHAPRKVCLKLTWRTTYSRRPVPPCTFPNSWRASTPPSTLPLIARAWSLRSARKWPAAIASCAPARTLSLYVRRPDDSLCRLDGDRGGLGAQFPSAAHPAARRAPGPGRVGLRGPTLSVAHHLDSGSSAAQLVERVLSPLALPLGTADSVCGRVAARLALLSRPPGGRRRRRHPPAQDGPRHSPGTLSPRSPLAPFSCQPDARLAFSASFSAAAPTSAGQHQLPRSARAL